MIQSNWKLSLDGKTASRTIDSGAIEYRLVEAIAADELAQALPADPIHPNVAILEQITTLEATITPRRMREAMLGTDKGWMKSLDAQIATLRSSLT